MGGGAQTDATKTSQVLIQVAVRLSIRLIVTSQFQLNPPPRVHPVPPLICESLI